MTRALLAMLGFASAVALAAATTLDGAALRMESLAAAPKTGACKTMNTASKLGNPDSDYESGTCKGGNQGNFNPAVINVHDLKGCAQYIRDNCAAGSAYAVSYLKGVAGETYLNAEGDCAWFAQNACPCVGGTGSCTTNAALQQDYVTAVIADVLVSGTEGGNGVEPVAGGAAKDPNKMEGVQEDPANVLNEASQNLLNAGTPQKPELTTVQDASQIDLEQLRENPNAIFNEGLKIGEVEPNCPDDYAAAKNRGEWQCMKRRAPITDITMYVWLGTLFVWLTCVMSFAMVGRRIRNKQEEDLVAEEEEEEEEEYDE